jgi:sporulation protein YlmC with PRC-barrel domain
MSKSFPSTFPLTDEPEVNQESLIEKYILVKGSTIRLTYQYEFFITKDSFANGLIDHISLNSDYYVQVKVKYDGVNYFTVDKQIIVSFKYNDKHNLEELYKLYNSLNTRLLYLLIEYDVKTVDFVQVTIKKFNILLLSDFKKDDNFNNRVSSKEKITELFPLSNDPSKLGEVCDINLINNNTQILLKTYSSIFKDFIINIKNTPEDSVVLNTKTKFVLRNISIPNVIAILKHSESLHIKEIYDINGRFLNRVYDKQLINKNLERKSSRSLILFDEKNNMLLKENINLKVKCIKKDKFLTKKITS